MCNASVCLLDYTIRSFWLEKGSSPSSSDQANMPAAKKEHACDGTTDGCVYSRALYQYDYPCGQCNVRTETIGGGKTFVGFCILCFYANPGNQRCREAGCMNAMKRVKILQGQMRAQDAEMSTTTGILAGPSNAASSNEAQQEVETIRDEVQLVKNWVRDIQKQFEDEVLGLKMQVVELKQQVTEMQAHVDKLKIVRVELMAGSVGGIQRGAFHWEDASGRGIHYGGRRCDHALELKALCTCEDRAVHA